MFTGDVFDREEEYTDKPTTLANLFSGQPQFAFVDELISAAVQPKPSQRIQDLPLFAQRVDDAIQRIEAGGRVLDLSAPKVCLFCGRGHYRPLHDIKPGNPYGVGPAFPSVDSRANPPVPNPMQPAVNQYLTLRNMAETHVGIRPPNQIPLYLICDFCGNVQYFRFDLTHDGYGKNWRP